MAQESTTRIERAEDAFSYYGYIVTSKPIDGMESVYADELWAGLKRVEKFMGKRKGKKAISLLHECIAVPCWGVEVFKS